MGIVHSLLMAGRDRQYCRLDLLPLVLLPLRGARWGCSGGRVPLVLCHHPKLTAAMPCSCPGLVSSVKPVPGSQVHRLPSPSAALAFYHVVCNISWTLEHQKLASWFYFCIWAGLMPKQACRPWMLLRQCMLLMKCVNHSQSFHRFVTSGLVCCGPNYTHKVKRCSMSYILAGHARLYAMLSHGSYGGVICELDSAVRYMESENST